MNYELVKRILTSLVLLPILIYCSYNSGFYFIIFLSTIYFFSFSFKDKPHSPGGLPHVHHPSLCASTCSACAMARPLVSGGCDGTRGPAARRDRGAR